LHGAKLTPRILVTERFYSTQRLDLFALCVRLSRLSVGFRTHFKSTQFHFISFLYLEPFRRDARVWHTDGRTHILVARVALKYVACEETNYKTATDTRLLHTIVHTYVYCKYETLVLW